MEILTEAIIQTLRLLFRMAPVMFISLIGVEILMQLGAMRKLEPLGRPLARISHLPAESALTFLAGLGSLVAAHTMAAQLHQDGKLTRQEMLVTAVMNTVPFHFKETFTFHLPVVLPLLGVELSMIYIAVFWLAGLLKLAFVIFYGRFRFGKKGERKGSLLPPECLPEDPDCEVRTVKQVVVDAFNARKKLLRRMLILLTVVTLAVQILVKSGLMRHLDALIAPLTASFGLPPAVVGPLSVYIFSPTVGITYMANILAEGQVSGYQAIVAILAGGFIMVPLTRLRGTLPRYTAYFGFRSGAEVCFLTTALSLLARGMVLVWVVLFYQ